MNKLSVSEIIQLLFYQLQNLRGKRVPTEILQKGQIIHGRLGFVNVKLFQRFYYSKKTKSWWLISGMPDKLDIEKGEVQELKTYYLFTKENQHKAGWIAGLLYCWLTGLPKFRVFYYDTVSEEITKEVVEKKNDKVAKQIIEKAISLKLMMKGFEEAYKKEV